MKNITTKHLLVLFSFVLFQACSSFNTNIFVKKEEKKSSLRDTFGSFDKYPIPNEAPNIEKMISIVQPELKIEDRKKIANDIFHAINKHKVEPQIIVALIDTESDFQYDMVSKTGDLSLGQINADVWNIEFRRMKLPLIKKEFLISKDQSYAIEQMAQILTILKKRHGKKDRRWYARYHSNTKKYKMDYLKKIEIRMKMLALHQTFLAKN